MLDPMKRLPKLSKEEKETLLAFAYSSGLSYNDFVKIRREKYYIPKYYTELVLDKCLRLKILNTSKNKFEGYTITRFGFYIISMLTKEAFDNAAAPVADERRDN